MAQGGESIWVATTPETDYPQLPADVEVDVAVVGAGITGITAAIAAQARRASASPCSTRSGSCRGATGYTTAKVTSGHGVVYGQLTDTFGEDGARVYAESNQAAIERIAELASEGGIDCDFERKDNYVVAEQAEERELVEQEAEAMRKLGLPASFVTETPLPFEVAGAVKLENQAQFHPRKYLLGLAATIPGDGSHVFENTRVTHVNQGDPCVVETERGNVRARDVDPRHAPARSWTAASSSRRRIRTAATRSPRRSTRTRRPTGCSSTPARPPARCGRSATASDC